MATSLTDEPTTQQSEIRNPKSEIEENYPAIGYAWYVVGVLTLVLVFSFVDRQILNLLVVPIRRDLGISDTQMSLLIGFGFAVFYTLFGLLLGRYADRGNRTLMIAIGFVVWSLMTATSGLANSFAALLLFRIGVGIGEATLGPAAYSLISDYFPPEKRATAFGVYSMGIYIGSGLAFLLGGLVVTFASQQNSWQIPLVGAVRSWQLIFFLVGLPGVLFALLVFTIREPARREVKKEGGKTTFRQTLQYLSEIRGAIACHYLGFALVAVFANGTGAWIPTFFERLHGWTPGQIGIALGFVVMIFGTLGVVAGGKIADTWSKRGAIDANLRVALYAILLCIPFAAAFPLVGDATLALALYVAVAFLSSVPFGVGVAALQQMMPNEMRGQASALYLFVINLLGLGAGPTLIALLTDYVFQRDGAVNLSLVIVGVAALALAAALLWLGLAPYRAVINRVNEARRAV